MTATIGAYSRGLHAWLGGLVPDCIDSVDDFELKGLTGDSREVRTDWAFLALPGIAGHGLDYLDRALAAGASVVLWPADSSRSGQSASRCAAAGVAGLPIPDLVTRAGELVSAFFDYPSRLLRLVGVTGTDGKTSVARLVSSALEAAGRPAGMVGTLGWGRADAMFETRHTTPDLVRVHALLRSLIDQGCGFVAMEVSSHGLDQGRTAGIEFEVAVLTNLGRDHLDYHGDLASYRAAKGKLFSVPGLGAAVLNLDDEFGQELAAAIGDKVPVWGFGTDRRSRVRLIRYEPEAGGSVLDLEIDSGRYELRSTLLGRFNASNLLAALTTLLALGLTPGAAVSGLAGIGPVPGRMEAFRADGAPAVVVDYAHTPQALAAALSACRDHFGGRVFCVFGCGGDRDRGKRPLMAAAAEAGADLVILTDDNPRTESPVHIVDDIIAGFSNTCRFQVVHERAGAIATAVAAASPQDVVLVAGKGHEREQLTAAGASPFSDRDVVRQLLTGRSDA